jgi:hypothetical protein
MNNEQRKNLIQKMTNEQQRKKKHLIDKAKKIKKSKQKQDISKCNNDHKNLTPLKRSTEIMNDIQKDINDNMKCVKYNALEKEISRIGSLNSTIYANDVDEHVEAVQNLMVNGWPIYHEDGCCNDVCYRSIDEKYNLIYKSNNNIHKKVISEKMKNLSLKHQASFMVFFDKQFDKRAINVPADVELIIIDHLTFAVIAYSDDPELTKNAFRIRCEWGLELEILVSLTDVETVWKSPVLTYLIEKLQFKVGRRSELMNKLKAKDTVWADEAIAKLW